MSSLYETFVMEIRPRLQSCNVFFILKPETKNRILVRLKENEIVISSTDNEDKIKISNFRILINSLSCLQASSSYLSFRFQTQNPQKSQGQFKSELLVYNLQMYDSIKNNNIQINNDDDYIIKCANCKNTLSETLKFNRILPLPSENLDTQDWFCHRSDATNNIKLTPGLTDCFYSNCYIHLNSDNFKNYQLVSNSILICKRCFSWLGLSLTSGAFQLWFNTIVLESSSICLYSNPLFDFKSTVRLEFKEAMFSPCKVLFECRNTARTEYLCIWILEKNLELFMKGGKWENSTNDVKIVAKVLFYFSSEVDKTINEWLNDNFVSNIKISKPMMLKGLNHLYDMCKLIPNCFRTSNNFYVSYIIL